MTGCIWLSIDIGSMLLLIR